MLVMRQRSLKNIYIQQALLAVLPRLAAFNPTIFSTKLVLRFVIVDKHLTFDPSLRHYNFSGNIFLSVLLKPVDRWPGRKL